VKPISKKNSLKPSLELYPKINLLQKARNIELKYSKAWLFKPQNDDLVRKNSYDLIMHRKERGIRELVRQIRTESNKDVDLIVRFGQRSDNIVLNALQSINVIVKNPNLKPNRKLIFDQGYVCKLDNEEL